MKVYALSDLHVSHRANREALENAFDDHPEDWLLLGGDIGEKEQDLIATFEVCTARFGRVFWTPGNHELWVTRPEDGELRGEAKYRRLIELCREFGVTTPEDSFPLWEGPGGPALIAPLFLLYDYSFRPAHVPADGAVEWAKESGLLCADEHFLKTEPFANITEWNEARLSYTISRLEAARREHPEAPFVLLNHYPLREDLVRLWRIPRFKIWCGTKQTEDWHRRWNARVVVHGHLHIRSTDYRDGVRFEEVSLGYPRHWNQKRRMEDYLREILPGPG